MIHWRAASSRFDACPAPPRAGVLRAEALRWHRARRWIVDGVDLEVRSGEIVGLLGPNGAGKTVTLSMIAGLLIPTSGRVLIDDIELTRLPLHERARLGLGYLPQERSVFGRLSVRDNVALILETHGVVLTRDVTDRDVRARRCPRSRC